ncbi:MAG: YdcF family protein [Deltaproteobacteria bacterium]|nr:YdcF family protein [Deltaproteobacteria bacterium]
MRGAAEANSEPRQRNWIPRCARNRLRQRRRWAFFSGLLIALWYALLLIHNEDLPGHASLKAYLHGKLFHSARIGSSGAQKGRGKRVVYVMGGSQEFLPFRFKTAALVYKEGLAGRVMILKEESITEYDPALKRNLTKTEWQVKKLVSLGVKAQDIEAIEAAEGMFGTLSEADAVSVYARKNKLEALLIVSSPYHTERVWQAFSNRMKDGKIGLFIHPSEDTIYLKALIAEYFKLQIYGLVLLAA